ncbi:MAG TPA: DUF2935 domain-containing protein [Candidatus Scybalousia intestinigallinarum]|nr:DUF2935 domain-containing protein [Candidatus Scybalousia intestinigallinarum]
MINDTLFVQQSLTDNLFYLRTIRDFTVNIEISLPVKYQSYIDTARDFRKRCDEYLEKVLELSNNTLLTIFWDTGIFITPYTLSTELLTEKLFGIDLNTVLTEEEEKLNTIQNAPTPTEDQLIVIERLNNDAIILATNFFDYVSSILNDMLTQEIFSYSYPLFYNFMLREIGLYINDLKRINEKTSIDPIFVLGYESRYSLSMKNIAQFISGLADPSQEAIIQKAREFEQRFSEILDEYNKSNLDPTFQNELSQMTLATVQEFQDFLETIIKRILNKELYFIVEPLFWDNLFTFILYFNYLLQGVIYDVKKA